MNHLFLLISTLIIGNQVFSQPTFPTDFENESYYPLIGNWLGEWINPQKGHEKYYPFIAAQVNVIDSNLYMVHFLPELHKRATLYLDVEARKINNEIIYENNDWKFIFSGDSCTGFAILHGDKTYFRLSKVNLVSPTLGKPAPEGAVDLLADGKAEAWIHEDGREEITWKLKEGVLETVSLFWNQGQNQKDGIGGSIRTRDDFSDLSFHMEFRYPVEPGLSGQMRGNSGLFFHGVGEIQILNSYGLPGYWDECGAIYKRYPPKVNAAGPPLEWQTYDVDLILPRYNAAGEKISNAVITVRLNGILIHNQMEIDSDAKRVTIGLQDHINMLQYRNIWVLEK